MLRLEMLYRNVFFLLLQQESGAAVATATGRNTLLRKSETEDGRLALNEDDK